MHESSAEYVMQRVNKDLRGKRTVSISSRLRTLLNEKKWQVIFGSCLILTVTAVAIPAGVSHTLRESGPQPSHPHNTAAQGEPGEGRAKKQRVDYGNTVAETAKRLQPVAHAAPLNHRKPGSKKQQESQAVLINHLKPGTKNQQDAPAETPNDEKPGAKKQQEAFIEVRGHENSTELPETQPEPQPQPQPQPPPPPPPPPAAPPLTEEPPTVHPKNTALFAEHKQDVSVQAEGIYRFSPVPETAPGDHYEKDLRLPKTVEPLEYKLKFEPVYTDQSVFFKGHARIFIQCKENTKMIQMHASNLIIDRSNSSLTTVDEKPGPEILNIRTNDFSQFLYIYLADDIIAGEKYYLNIPFTSIAFYDNGFNVRHYTRDNSTVWVIGTNFLPTEARRAFPCFDEPGLKSVFNMEVIRDSKLHTLSNMPLAKVYPKSKGKAADTFVKTFPMSTFSVGFFISDFVSYGNTSFKLWTRPGILKDVDFLLELGPKILKFYETYFAMPYQVPKMDVVAMEHYINDVQNMGLLYLPENIAFYDPEEASIAKKQSVLLALCHAFSHEWFGNLVTPEWWDDVWVMDGFATYFQYRCLENFDRTPKSYHLMVINDVISVMKHDIVKYSPAIVMEVDTQYRIYQAFNVFSTQKAVAVLRMLDMAMGEDTFKRGIHDILTSRMFKSVTSQMIWHALTQVQPKKRPLDVKRIMEAWTNQSGFPVLSVTRIYDENSATLVQSKFSLEAEERESKDLWPIPITFVTSEDRSFNKTRPVIWLYEKEGQLENLASPHNWVLFNNRFSGYYKINYDERNWDLLIRQLLWNHTFIDPLNRAQIQNDLFDLAKAGMVNYTLALEATKYLLREQDFIPWKTAFDKMKDVGVYLRTTTTYSKWKGYLSTLLSANYENISWNGNTTSGLTRDMEAGVVSLACSYDFEPCVDKVAQIFKAVKESTELAEEIPPHLRYTVFCEAVKKGEDASWKFLWDKLQESEDPAERSDIIKALSCSKSATVLANYVRSVLLPKSEIRTEDVPSLLSSLSTNHDGKAVAFRFLHSQWPSIHQRYLQSPEVLFHIEESFIESASHSDDIDELHLFYKHNKKTTMIPEWRYKQVQEERKMQDTWQTKYYPVIKNWLDKTVPV